jgi:hypothetical protein
MIAELREQGEQAAQPLTEISAHAERHFPVNDCQHPPYGSFPPVTAKKGVSTAWKKVSGFLQYNQ